MWYFGLYCVWEKQRQRVGVPPPLLRDRSVWVGLLHVSTSLLQHLLPLTFRPTPHTLCLQRMLHPRGHSETQSPATGDFPWCCTHVVCVYLCVHVFVRACLSVHFQGTPRIADWGGRTKLTVNVKIASHQKCLGSSDCLCVCASVCVCVCIGYRLRRTQVLLILV